MKNSVFLFKSVIVAILVATVFTACTKEKRYSNRLIGTWELTQQQDNGVNTKLGETDHHSFQFNKNGTFTWFWKRKDRTSSSTSRVINGTTTGKWEVEKGSVLTFIVESETRNSIKWSYSIAKLKGKELQLQRYGGTDHILYTYRKK